MAARYAADDLVRFATELLARAGLDADKAGTTAELLVEADLITHTTHGLQLLASYLGALEDGSMARDGEPEVVVDRGAQMVWDGRRLPGLWTTARAIDEAIARSAEHGVVTVAVRRSHHIGCLAAYLQRATSKGRMLILMTSDPAGESVAPFGGLDPVFTPDPFAIGIPTGGDPIMIDTSASITTNGLTGRLHKEGERLPGPWVQDHQGRVGDDPAVLFTDPPGTILPTGGQDHGHKGFALALLVEALTQGLGGFGRADGVKQWGAAVFVQVLDPDAFAGVDAFRRQTRLHAERSRASRPLHPDRPVRVPGDGALARKRQALAEGLALHPGIMDGLESWAEKLGVAVPEA